MLANLFRQTKERNVGLIAREVLSHGALSQGNIKSQTIQQAFQFALSNADVMLVGTTQPKHLHDNIALTNAQLTFSCA